MQVVAVQGGPAPTLEATEFMRDEPVTGSFSGRSVF
jgi:hypothetical protein